MACVYRHIRKDTNMPFYIGIGSTIQRAYSKTHRNTHWLAIVKKTDYEVDILFDDIDYEFAKKKEIEFIELYKRKEDNGTLCNITKGGDGVLGLKHTEEARRKMGEPNKGKLISEWHKKRISEFHKGKIVSEETRKKMSEKLKGENSPNYGRIVSKITRGKMSTKRKGEDNPASKLNAEKVLEIRKLYKQGNSSIKIGKMFDVSKGCILAIVNYKSWQHI